MTSPWDIQRLGQPKGTIKKEWRDIATISIGIYAAASGMSFNEIMNIQTAYVKVFGGTWLDEKKDSVWNYIPEKNVQNTKIGFDLYRNGLIK
ncbi:hypothetical protein AA106555_1891 [Neokomagataea thailandica NBRC 106555]|uniref:Uncharacterized protein n=2 Tax=Neokomagataea TaxID=1223423 RepID=A0A4Y6V9K9_9PROT|nr:MULTISPECIES: hypothetical protein [Neokomagataea]QDH26034.1 hypothetical protein D5366_11455 [Neokomagataea tanensis]GBR54983.1 hypothetical protein AA106555_1891 [Neokomagataea thailandica NBRC 106555]